MVPFALLCSLEVQCGAASELPPEAAPHLQGLHVLFCDWDVLCSSPSMLAGCRDLRSLHVLVNGPPLTGGAPRQPRAPRRLVPQLLDQLASLPHLAALRLVNNVGGAGAGEMRPVPAEAQRLLSQVAERLPRLHIQSVTAARPGPMQPRQGLPGMELDFWAA